MTSSSKFSSRGRGVFDAKGQGLPRGQGGHQLPRVATCLLHQDADSGTPVPRRQNGMERAQCKGEASRESGDRAHACTGAGHEVGSYTASSYAEERGKPSWRCHKRSLKPKRGGVDHEVDTSNADTSGKRASGVDVRHCSSAASFIFLIGVPHFPPQDDRIKPYYTLLFP